MGTLTSAPLRAVSLFSNCGAGDLGYARAGFRFEVMAELDERRLEVALLNHASAVGLAGDLRITWPYVVRTARQIFRTAEIAMLAACPPCQGMSTARSDRGHEHDPAAGSRDSRNLLVVVIAEVAKALRPLSVVIENVPAFLSRKVLHPRDGTPVSAASLLVEMLTEDYEVFPFLTDLNDYGIPQTRKRAFLTFIRKDVEGLRNLKRLNRAPYPRPTHTNDLGGPAPPTLGDFLRQVRLPKLDSASEKTACVRGYQDLHCVPVISEDRYAMVAAIPPGSGQSAWENNTCPKCGEVDAESEDVLCGYCQSPLMRPIVKLDNGSYRLVKGFRSSSYRRMSPNSPAATITTASGHLGSDNTIHPYEHRVLSPMECALLQTIPPGFNWGRSVQAWGHSNVRKMIGEAVPPLFTELHGRALKGVLESNWSIAPVSVSDRRCARAWRRVGESRTGASGVTTS